MLLSCGTQLASAPIKIRAEPDVLDPRMKGPEVNATKFPFRFLRIFADLPQLSPSRPKRRDLRSGYFREFLGGNKERWREDVRSNISMQCSQSIFHLGTNSMIPWFIIATRKLHSFAPGSKLLRLGMVITVEEYKILLLG